MDGEAVLLAKEGYFIPLVESPKYPQTLFGVVETLSQTLPDVILELTVLSAQARSRGVIPEAHPLSNGVRLEISRFQWRG